MNVDQAEIAKFEELASRWWDPTGEFKPLHDMNPVRIDYIKSYTDLAGKRVLDVGCGGGILSEAMARLGADVTGIDMGEAPLAVAKMHLKESGVDVDYQQITIEELADQQDLEKFDVITCLEMLEHVPDPSSVVNACSKLLKPEGELIFSTINRNPKAWAFAIVGAEYLLHLLPQGTHDYDKFIKPSELESWVRNSGLQMRDLTGMHYNPLNKLFSLVDDVSINYLARVTA